MKHNLFSDRFHLSPEIQDENLFLMQLNGRISRRKKKDHHHSGRYSATGRALILFPVWHIILFPFSLNVIWELSIINGPLIGHFFDWHFLFLFYFPRNLSVVPFTNCKNKPKKKKNHLNRMPLLGRIFWICREAKRIYLTVWGISTRQISYSQADTEAAWTNGPC